MNSKATKAALVTSIASLVLCFTMLMGTTLAWFVDRVENTNNRIEAGNLAVDLVMYNSATKNYVSIAKLDDDIDIFTLADAGGTLWSPGVSKTVYFGVRNTGSLPIKYNAYITVDDKGLAGALQYAVALNHGAGTISSFEEAVVAEGPSGPLGVPTVTVAEGEKLEKIATDPNNPENQNETAYYALTVTMIGNADPDIYQNKTVNINIVVNAQQLTADDISDEDVSVLSEIPDEEKATTLSATSWKFNEAIADYDFFADFDYETEDSEYILPSGCIISDGENEYEFSGFEFAEREEIKLLTVAPVATEEEADASDVIEEAEKSDLAFVYYAKEADAETDTESEENVNGWYLLELESLQAALGDETADLADLIKDKEMIKDAEKLPVISFADEESDALQNSDLIDWLYQSAELQIPEQTE